MADQICCPRKGHSEFRVVKGGFYGRGELKRQQYKCYGDGETIPPHRFALRMPRIGEPAHECLECEVTHRRGSGRHAPKTFDFDARTIAAALLSVARGQSYLRAASEARMNGVRNRANLGKAAQLVSDWVEVFTPLLWEKLALQPWPKVLVCDSTTVKVETNPPKRWPPPPTWQSNKIDAYGLYVITGRLDDGTMKPVFAWATVATAERAWAEVFDSCKSGPPDVIVSDEDTAIIKAVQSTWDNATPYWIRCVYHLLTKLPTKLPVPLRGQPNEPQRLASEATRGVLEWDAFIAACDKVADEYDHDELRRWLTRLDMRNAVRRQLDDHPDLPQSNAAVEATIRQLRNLMGTRDTLFRNKERTNRCLQLFILGLQGTANETAFTNVIRDHIQAGGQVSPVRRILDPNGISSLRPQVFHAPRSKLTRAHLEDCCNELGIPVPPRTERRRRNYVPDLDGPSFDSVEDYFAPSGDDPDAPF